MEESEFDRSGCCVSLHPDNNTVAIGAFQNDASEETNIDANFGHVRVFEFVNDGWSQIGGDIDGQEYSEHFGRFVALSEEKSLYAVGNFGRFRICEPNENSNWSQVATMATSGIGGDPVISPFFGSGHKVKLPDLPGHVYRLLQGGGVTINAEIMACPADKATFLQTRTSLFSDQKIIEGTYVGKIFIDVADISFRYTVDLSKGMDCFECVLPDGSSWDGDITDGEVKQGVDPDYRGTYKQRILSIGGGVMKFVVRIYDHPQVQNEFQVLSCDVDPAIHDGLLIRNYKPKLFFLNDLCDNRILTNHKKNKKPLTFRHPVVHNQVAMKCA